MSALTLPESPSENTNPAFDWPLCYEAERVVRRHVESARRSNSFIARLAEKMSDEAGLDFFEWVDHIVIARDAEQERELRTVGFEDEAVEAPPGLTVLWHPRAMMPRVLVGRGAREAGPCECALRVECVADFVAAHDLDVWIEGAAGARFRRAPVGEENGVKCFVVERLGHRGFAVREPTQAAAAAMQAARELWRTRKRDFAAGDETGVGHAMGRLDAVLALVDRDAACELFFAEERVFWEKRNRAAQVQKRRQDRLGLGWGNHDHHTFRCSRRHFTDLMFFLGRLGFQKRERYYAGAQAGWGAQISEQPVAGIVVFADVDLMPEETAIDFSSQRLPAASRLGTVGLWCGLHGDSFLQAGMHHLEARFDFARARDQLAKEGVATMKPFSDFEFLRQAFTEGERWPVRPTRVEALRAVGLITAAQAEGFLRDGAIGSHLENLQRKGGFKGFNQKSVSVIIAATDPRTVQAGH